MHSHLFAMRVRIGLARVTLVGRVALGLAARAAATDRVVLPDDVVPAHDHITVTPDPKASGEPPTTLSPETIGVASTRHPAMAFDFGVAQWDKVAPLVEPNSRPEALARLIAASADLALIDRLEAFAVTHIGVSGRRPLRQAKARVRHQARIRPDRPPEVDAWLKAGASRHDLSPPLTPTTRSAKAPP